MGPNVLSQSVAGFFYQLYLQKKSMKQPDFLHDDANSHELKVDQKIFGWAWSKMGVTSMVMGHWSGQLTASQE